MRITPFAAFAGIEDDPAHSPSLTQPDGGEYTMPAEVATHRPVASDSASWRWEADPAWREHVHPSEGGIGGPSIGLGWTTGLKPRREVRSFFDGRTLVVAPGQAAMPIVGEVGRDNRAQRLIAGTDALTTDYLPSLDVIAASFTRPGGNALTRELLGQM